MNHDTGYRLLFRHNAMMRDLLKLFVGGEWLADADFSTLCRVNANFVSQTADPQQRHEDMVWKIQLKDSRWLYVYILLEFQSTNDHWMALRMMVYLGLLYQELVLKGELDADGKLPPVLPIVLYNGPGAWTGSLRTETLVAVPPPSLQSYVPACGYLLIDENRYGRQDLNSQRNLVAALFRLETQRGRDDVIAVVEALVQWLADEGNRDLSRDFAIWIKDFVRKNAPVELPDGINEMQEVNSMFAENLKYSYEEYRRQGFQEGEIKGELRGEARILQRLLRNRFGPLSSEAASKIAAASSQQLLRWADLVLTAPSLDAIFGAELPGEAGDAE